MPMYNESANVDVTLPLLLRRLPEYFSDFEIVVADDAGTDDGAERVAEWARRDPRIRLIRLARNERFGGALRAGFEIGRAHV